MPGARALALGLVGLVLAGTSGRLGGEPIERLSVGVTAQLNTRSGTGFVVTRLADPLWARSA